MELRNFFQHQGNVKFNFRSIGEGFRTFRTFFQPLERYFGNLGDGDRLEEAVKRRNPTLGDPTVLHVRSCISELRWSQRTNEHVLDTFDVPTNWWKHFKPLPSSPEGRNLADKKNTSKFVGICYHLRSDNDMNNPRGSISTEVQAHPATFSNRESSFTGFP